MSKKKTKKKASKALEDLTSLATSMLSFEVEEGSPSHEFLKIVALGMEDSIQAGDALCKAFNPGWQPFVTDPALPYGNLSEDDFALMETGILKTRDPQPIVKTVGPIRWDFNMNEDGEFVPAETEEIGASMSDKKKDVRIKEVVHLLEAPIKGFDLRQVYHEALSIGSLYDHQQKKYRHDHQDTKYGTMRMPTKLVIALLENVAYFRKGLEKGFVLTEPKVSDADFKGALEKAFEDDVDPLGGRVVVRDRDKFTPAKWLPTALDQLAAGLCTYELLSGRYRVLYTYANEVPKGKRCDLVINSKCFPIRYVNFREHPTYRVGAIMRFICPTGKGHEKLRELARELRGLGHAEVRFRDSAPGADQFTIDVPLPQFNFFDEDPYTCHVDLELTGISDGGQRDEGTKEDLLPRWMRPLEGHINEASLADQRRGAWQYHLPANPRFTRLYFGNESSYIRGVERINLIPENEETPLISVQLDPKQAHRNRGMWCTKQGHVDTLWIAVGTPGGIRDVKYQARVSSVDLESGKGSPTIVFRIEGVLNWNPDEKGTTTRLIPTPEYLKPFENFVEPYIDPYCSNWLRIPGNAVTLEFLDEMGHSKMIRSPKDILCREVKEGSNYPIRVMCDEMLNQEFRTFPNGTRGTLVIRGPSVEASYSVLFTTWATEKGNAKLSFVVYKRL